ncbi:MAG: HAD-IA family hydrolase [Kineosporiaceae bacterium]
MDLADAEAYSFDCYGTLIDWETGLLSLLRPWADARGVTVADEALLAGYGRHESVAEREHPTDPYPAILARAFRDLGAQLGAPVPDDDADALAASVPDWPPFPDSHDALVALGRQRRLVVLSNVDRRSFAGSAEQLGVDFTSVLTAEDIGSYKPDARNFTALLAEAERLGVRPGRLVHVAQSLFHDHVPAQAAGLRTVWINRRHGRAGWGATPTPTAPVQPDWEFDSMGAFAAAVGAA